jgi:hypothetical protein
VDTVVEHCPPKLGSFPVLKNRLAPRCFLLFLLVLVVFALVLVGSSTAGAANVQNPPPAALGPASQFAIADFDGDIRPDVASIQSELHSSVTTAYWIQLQLSASGRQSIRLVAPAGGLLIEARDG